MRIWSLPALLAFAVAPRAALAAPSAAPAAPSALGFTDGRAGQSLDGAAAPSAIAITWTAPEGCPGADEIKAEVRRMAGAAAPTAEATEVHATVLRDPGNAWQLTLTTKVGARQGERKLGASDCAELGRAAALVIALMINPAADPSAAPPVVTPPPAPPPAPPPPPEPPRASRFALGAAVLVGSGQLPDGAIGLGARFAVGGGAFSAQLRGDLWFPRDAGSAAKPSAGGSFGAVDLGLGGCLTARPDRRLGPNICAGAAVTGTHATGFGVNNPGAATVISAGAFLEGALRVKLTTRNALRVGIEALAPFERPSFALAGVGTVFRPAPIWLRGTLGWELNF